MGVSSFVNQPHRPIFYRLWGSWRGYGAAHPVKMSLAGVDFSLSMPPPSPTGSSPQLGLIALPSSDAG